LETLDNKRKIPKGWKLVLIPVQHMFPNCQVRYRTKCTNMKTCIKEVQEIKITFPPKYGDYTLLTAETIRKERKRLTPPKDFENHKAKRIKI